jgi:hypothetical protein
VIHTPVAPIRLEKYAERAIAGASVVLILLGLWARIYGYALNRSLWLDEAFLASSVIKRGFLALLEPLDYNQGAPIGFLWLTKLAVTVLGDTEYILRLAPFVAGILSVYLFYAVLARVFSVKQPLLGTAFYATVPFLIYYTYEFKPYMVDACITLCTIWLSHRVFQRRMHPGYFFLYTALIVWCSFPAIFLLTALYGVWLAQTIYRQDWPTMRVVLVGGALTAASFLLYYGFFYGNISASQSNLYWYWERVRFPLFPSSIAEVKRIRVMLDHYADSYSAATYYLIVLATPISLIAMLFGRYRFYGILFVATIVGLLVASWLGKYGMFNRILLFAYPINALFIAVLAQLIREKSPLLYYAYSAVILLACVEVTQLLRPEGVFRQNQELRPLIKSIEAGKLYPLYLYRRCAPQFEYYTRYASGLSVVPNGPLEVNNVVYGSKYYTHNFDQPYSWASTLNPEKLALDVRAIQRCDSMYLLFGHGPQNQRDTLINTLKTTGVVDTLQTHWGCALLRYTPKPGAN